MRVVLGESQLLVGAGLSRLLEAHSHAQVVGHAVDGRQLVDMTAHLQPDAVLTEIDLPSMTGLEALVQIRRQQPEVAVLMLSSLTDIQHVRAALHHGAAGFISKHAAPDELGNALRAVELRQTYLSPAISQRTVALSVGERQQLRVELTPRQREVLHLIARGNSTREIGRLMGVSVKTVETHRARLMQSLGLQGTNALMRYAIRIGLDMAYV